MFVINDDYRMLQNGQVKEGGLARNEALIAWVKKNKNAREIKLDQTRIQNGIKILNMLNRTRNETILMFYPTVGVPILKNGVLGNLCSTLFFRALKKACKNNRIIIDICDLKYEQAIDLDLDKERRETIKEVENKLFGFDCYYIFASTSMMEYARKKYSIQNEKCFVIDNGSSLVSEQTEFDIDDRKINLIYSGTLNKGRNISKMLECVSENNNVVLYLCGTGGEWIENSKNIRYLGALEEKVAHYIVSQCDLGLIPYDETRQYYHIAYPTKLSFYITAGIPFLSTDVKEVRNIQKKYNIGYISEISNWQDIIANKDKSQINAEKTKARNIQNEFTWDYKCRHSIIFNSL